jgi:uncharacterized protein
METFALAAAQPGTSSVDSVSPNGLIGVNGVLVQGSVLIFPRLCLLWRNVHGIEDVTAGSLSMLFAMQPHTEYLLLGVMGPPRVPASLLETCRRHKVTVEAMSRENAAAQFNVLMADGRRVAAGFPHPAPHIV